MQANHFESQLAEFPRERTFLLPALLLAQASLGHVPDWAIERIAAHLRLTVNDIDGVATGYRELRRAPPGDHLVRVCSGLSCWTHGSGRLLVALEAALGIKAGETSSDRRFTLEEIACCFVCAVAPAIEVDGEVHGRLSEPAALDLVERVRS